ncbi:MAG: 3-hydroxyacyl-CoA dehydrogenase [Methanocorpusculum sp.]|nr:3-hydroxyacyl-CoA dehydrogenase [Methanocorpusculum sp.]
MAIKTVVVIGGGVLGSQIAYQTAYAGFDVITYLRSQESINRTKPKADRLHAIYLAELNAAKEHGGPVSRGLVFNETDMSKINFDALIEKAETAYQTMHYETDLAAAVKDADLVIEALAENPEIKMEFYKKMSTMLPEKTIIATNSSTLLPSVLAASTGRPEKFLALHFANSIWRGNTAEIMGHSETDPAAYDAVVDFAAAIGMIPLKLKKEKAGYILNSLLVPFLSAAEQLLADDISDVETIDKTWMLATGAPTGPFRILDVVGITTAYNIVCNYPDAKDPSTMHGRIAKLLKEEYIDKGKLGLSSGEGFYKYT